MADVLIDEGVMTALGNLLREKNNTATKYYPAEMEPAFRQLIEAGGGGGSSGGGGEVGNPVLIPLEVTENGIFLPPVGVDGFSQVTVNIPAAVAPAHSELEYLTPNAAEYIKTGIKPTSETKVEIKVRRDAFSDECLFGSRKSSSSSDRFLAFMSQTTNAHCQYYNQSYGITVPDYTGVDLVIELSKNGYYYNGELLQEVPQTSFTSTYEMYLFALNQANSVNRPISNIRFYYCKIWQNDVLVRDYVPVLLGGAVVCLFDKVNQKYYFNAGDGEFTAGPVKE